MSTGSIKGWGAHTVTGLLRRNQGNVHSGLVFDRWLAIWTDARESAETVKLIEPLQGFAGEFNRRGYEPTSAGQLKEHHARLARCGNRESRVELDLQVQWRFVSGFGAAHPSDNGFSFDPVIGVPCITGSAIKGLCRRAAKLSDAPDARLIEALFGPEEGQTDSCGDLVFYDALPLEWPRLVVDIVNCHYPTYYGALGTSAGRGKPPSPSETEDPNPVFFLAVDHDSSFRFVITSRSGSTDNAEQGVGWLKEGMGLLGIGAKTAVGYGTMASVEGIRGADARPKKRETQTWQGVTLRYNKGSSELSGNHVGNKAFVTGDEARTLVGGLSSAAQKKLQKGRLDARLSVEHLGGKNWKIVKIDLD